MLQLVGTFEGDDAVIFGNDARTHPSELLHLIWRCPNLRGLKFGKHGCFHGQLEQDLGDVFLGAADLLLDGLGDDGSQIIHVLALLQVPDIKADGIRNELALAIGISMIHEIFDFLHLGGVKVKRIFAFGLSQ